MKPNQFCCVDEQIYPDESLELFSNKQIEVLCTNIWIHPICDDYFYFWNIVREKVIWPSFVSPDVMKMLILILCSFFCFLTLTCNYWSWLSLVHFFLDHICIHFVFSNYTRILKFHNTVKRVGKWSLKLCFSHRRVLRESEGKFGTETGNWKLFLVDYCILCVEKQTSFGKKVFLILRLLKIHLSTHSRQHEIEKK